MRAYDLVSIRVSVLFNLFVFLLGEKIFGRMFTQGEENMQENNFYKSKKWIRKRQHILRADKYKCQVALWYGRTEEATIVHHIYPLKDYPEYALSDWNLISVSMKSHNKLENRSTGELTKLGLWLKEKTIPGEDWRKKKTIL